MKVWFGFSVTVLVLMWGSLLIAFLISLWQAYHFCKDTTLTQEKLPRIFSVRALSDAPPQSSTKTVDGVLLNKGDMILVWPRDVFSHHSAVWKLERKGWTYTDELRQLVPGSVVQVQEGLQYAHTSFAVRTSDSIVPLWQHWLLTSPTISEFYHQKGDNGTFILVSDEESRLYPTPMSDVLQVKSLPEC
jgi:hypothetical protein